MSDEDKPQPFDPDLAGLVLGAIRAKARVVALTLAAAVGGFVYMAADAGRPTWLVATIGIFGAVLIAFFVALVWFWLRFFSHFGAARAPVTQDVRHPEPAEGGRTSAVKRP